MPGALGLAAVYAATGLIADMIATSPLRAFEEQPNGVRVLRPSQPMLITDPDPYGGSVIDWLHQGLTSVLLMGNAYGYVLEVDDLGVPAKLAWLNPSAVSVVVGRQSNSV
jgi:phage portal protein BeeE